MSFTTGQVSGHLFVICTVYRAFVLTMRKIVRKAATVTEHGSNAAEQYTPVLHVAYGLQIIRRASIAVYKENQPSSLRSNRHCSRMAPPHVSLRGALPYNRNHPELVSMVNAAYYKSSLRSNHHSSGMAPHFSSDEPYFRLQTLVDKVFSSIHTKFIKLRRPKRPNFTD